MIKHIAEQDDGGFNLAAKIWNDFKQWRNEPKYIRRQTNASFLKHKQLKKKVTKGEDDEKHLMVGD